jgi:hypothetical protein
MMITPEAFQQLHYPKGLSRADISSRYCDVLWSFDLCPYKPNNNCNICVPNLQELTNGLEESRNPIALLKWRLRAHAEGRFSIWTSPQKGSSRRCDQYGLPTEDQVSFESLLSRIGVEYEATPAAC